VDATGLAVLRLLAAQGEGATMSKETLARQLSDPNDLNRVLALLSRRELIEAVDEGYRFQVELIRRWFAREPG
jgi:DNA-binding IclR family transcriptional regulator